MQRVLLVLASFWISASAWGLDSFVLPQMNGEQIGQMYSSSDHPTGIFVFEAYFNRCPYCHQNAPIIDELAAEFASEPRVQVIDLGRDCRDSDYTSWISRHNPNHPVLKDCEQKVLSQMGVSAFPTTVIYDCKGVERFRNVGTMDRGVYARAVSVIRAALSEPCGND
jgi:peroxiredoxin